MDKYRQRFITMINECKSEEEIGNVLDKVYEDGFQDGFEEDK